MKKRLLTLACSALCFGFSLTSGALAEEIPYAPVAERSEDLAPVKEAWALLQDAQPDLAARLERIVDGDRAGAVATLVEAASVVASDEPKLAEELDALAAGWAAE